MIEESHIVAFLSGCVASSAGFVFWYSHHCHQMRIRVADLLLKEWRNGFDAGHKSSYSHPKAK